MACMPRFPANSVSCECDVFPRFPFEMFYRIRDINFFSIDSGFLKRLIENLSSWSDKQPALNVFLIAWLLSHKHHSRLRTAFPKHGLRSALPKITRLAIVG